MQENLFVAEATNQGESTVSEKVPAFEVHYARLRMGIANTFTKLIEDGGQLFRASNKAEAFELFLDEIPHEDKQYYNCVCCRSFFANASTLVTIEGDGTVRSPLFEAFASDEFFGAPERRAALLKMHTEATKAAHVIPLAKLPAPLTRATSGHCWGVKGWTHFYAASSDVAAKYAGARDKVETFRKAKEVWDKMRTALQTPLADWHALHKTVAAKLDNPNSIGLLVPYFNLLEAMKLQPGRQVAILAALLQRKDYAWLHSIENTSAAHVLDIVRKGRPYGKTVEAIIESAISSINGFTDPTVYKKRTAATSTAAVDDAIAMLSKNGWDRALERTMPSFSRSVVKWLPSEENPSPEQSAPEMSALQSAAAKLKQNIDGDAGGQEALRSAIGTVSSRVIAVTPVSVVGFVQMLPSIASMKFCLRGNSFMPFLLTVAADGQHYAELLNCRGHASTPTAMVLMPAENLDRYQASYLVEDNDGFIPVIGADDSVNTAGQPMVMVYAEHVAQKLQGLFTKHGTLVLGTGIRQEYYGYSRALVQLSENTDLRIEDNPAGGFQLQLGNELLCVMKDGTTKLLRIASLS